ncbi:MAG TPA: class I SAM-dependent methyltransferase [Polyangiaceae bacterium]|nr:class I SAM-dependent methyltransferase [Polyangiaceae bacterium]
MSERPWFSLLRCPACGGEFNEYDRGEGGEGLRCRACARDVPVDAGVPRFVPRDNYARSFGLQWNAHARTQLDSYTGVPVSRDRLFSESGWSPDELAGRRVLECGSGAGRFTEVLAEAGADLYSLDYSAAVDANRKNNGARPNVHLLQASLYELPFADDTFDYLVCLGVVQHTPDVERAFKGMFRVLKPGGRFCIDVYAAPLSYLHPRHLLRPLTKRLPAPVLYRGVERAVPFLLPLSTALHRVPVAGEALARLVPVANWRANVPLPSERLWREWAVLDTFDWLSPAYEQPQRRRTLERWVRELGLARAEVTRVRGLYVVRGTK